MSPPGKALSLEANVLPVSGWASRGWLRHGLLVPRPGRVPLLSAIVCFTVLGCATVAPPPPLPEVSISPRAENETAEVRFICFAPSPYTNRHDALRAGFGIFLSLQQLIEAHNLPLSTSYYDGASFFEDTTQINKVLQDPQVLVLGGSTWVQGPAFYIRRFFELAGSQNLGGVSATAWATAGGYHTGGEVVVSTILRSLMGMGAKTFTMGQKYMVFSTDERLSPSQSGAFSLFDVWYMDQFARYIAVVALAHHDRQQFRMLSEQLGASPFYYRNNFPPDERTLKRFSPLQKELNAAADPDSDAYRRLRSLLSNAGQ